MEVNIFNTDKKYQIIYADPPWSYNDKKCNGACEFHYKTMNIADIYALPISDIADKDCVLFLWSTYSMTEEAIQVMKSWGFKFKSIGFQWIKLNKKNGKPFFGLGRWTRGNTEPCYIATKGKPSRIAKDISQLIFTPIGNHSEKPPIVRDKIVKLMGDLPRIELFARQQVDGWDCWGDEICSNP